MKQIPFHSAQFLGSMLKVDEPFRNRQGRPLPEIALVGRSNVGKSSLINHLLHQKWLAHVSSKPGKTTTLNFYLVDNDLVIVDLPGYGYAARSHDDQAKWSESVDTYFKQSKTLKLILLLVDSRRELSQEDLQIAKWASYYRKPLLLIFTKSDTISPHERKQAQEKGAVLLPNTPSLHYSIKEGKSRSLLISRINHFLTG